MNEHELERLARELGRRAGERVDVETTARAVVERLRKPVARPGWTPPEWLRVAATVVLLLGTGVMLERVANPGRPAMATSYGLEELGELTTGELEQVLATLDRTLSAEATDSSDVNLDALTPEQLQTLLQSLET